MTIEHKTVVEEERYGFREVHLTYLEGLRLKREQVLFQLRLLFKEVFAKVPRSYSEHVFLKPGDVGYDAADFGVVYVKNEVDCDNIKEEK